MPFKSQAQQELAQLLVEGKISNQTFEEWNRETGKKEAAGARQARESQNDETAQEAGNRESKVTVKDCDHAISTLAEIRWSRPQPRISPRLPVIAESDHDGLQVVIETPKNSRNKYTYDP